MICNLAVSNPLAAMRMFWLNSSSWHMMRFFDAERIKELIFNLAANLERAYHFLLRIATNWGKMIKFSVCYLVLYGMICNHVPYVTREINGVLFNPKLGTRNFSQLVKRQLYQ